MRTFKLTPTDNRKTLNNQHVNQYIKVWFETNEDTFVFSTEDNFNSEDIEATFESHKTLKNDLFA